ncbi:hypothetical protein DHD32_13735 [Arenibacter sp. TNZ]|jgi:hypothetical protein|uniref:hypothetical protein n=1 Tax=Arenibacter TaxID=178469 RepID=UPI000CD428D6|nr:MULTISPECIES: hypothetical protein [Arenibacter]MCM4172547.1 hypothetical protein [Arenibacter sp. TNZ]
MTLVKNLTNSYKFQLKALQDKTKTDEEKQKELLHQISKQIIYLLKLIGSIILFISPFISIFVIDELFNSTHSETLYSLGGTLVSLIAVVLYIIIKKQYVKLLKKRKNTT